MPVLIGSVLSLVALPVLALVWGARPADLLEVWAQFRAGFQIGETTISPTDFVSVRGHLRAGLHDDPVHAGLAARVRPAPHAAGHRGRTPSSRVSAMSASISALLAITLAGIDLACCHRGRRAVGRDRLRLADDRAELRLGHHPADRTPDRGGRHDRGRRPDGHVRSISVRSTRIETFDRRDVIIPNTDLISGAGHQLDPRQPCRAADPAGRRRLWQRRREGPGNPFRRRQQLSDGAGRSRAAGPVHGVRGVQPRFRTACPAARHQLDDDRHDRDEFRDQQAFR